MAQASPETTQKLANFAATLRYGDLPERVREHCKSLFLDALACAVAGHRGEETGQMAALAAALAQGRELSVIGGGHLSLAGATLLNGYLVTAVTMCDVHRATMTHVTPEIVPPVLAIAERDGLSGRDLLVAIAAGCEVTTRIGIGLDYPVFRARGWHGPGILGPFGAAAAVGSLLKFDADTMARAFGLAGSQAAGTFAAWGTPTVKFHQCRGALSGLMAALLAQQNFVATREFLTAKDGGLYNAYVNGGKPETATADLGQRFELEQIALRLWPSASLIQGLNTALFDIVEKHTIDPAHVRKVDIALSQATFDMHGGFRTYKAKFEALLSAHYTAAVILHDRALPWRNSNPPATTIPNCVVSRPKKSIFAPMPRLPARRPRSMSSWIVARRSRRVASIRSGRRKTRCRAGRSSKNSAAMRKASSPTPISTTSLPRWTGWRTSARCASLWSGSSARRPPMRWRQPSDI